MDKIIVTTPAELNLLIQTSIREALKEQSPQTGANTNNLLNVEEASQFLNLAKQTLYGFTSKNEIPYIKRGKKLYFRKPELEAWLNEGKRKSNKEIENELSGKI